MSNTPQHRGMHHCLLAALFLPVIRRALGPSELFASARARSFRPLPLCCAAPARPPLSLSPA